MMRQLTTATWQGGRRWRRRGSGYVLVITTAMLLSVIGFAAVINARTTTRMVVGNNSWMEAGALASSAVECALAQVRDTPDWRDQLASGVAEPQIATAAGSMQYVVVDVDGDLTDDIQDNVRVYGIGRVGDATRVCAVTLQPAGRQGLEVLKSALHADGNLTVSTDVSGGPFSCNAGLTNYDDMIGDVETVTLNNVGTITGTTTVPAAVKTMPSADVFDTYAAEATAVPFDWNFQHCVLSPSSNPFGTPNPGGVYILTAPAGAYLTVKNLRVWGTLLVRLPAGADVEFKSLIIHPYRADQPALLIDCEAAGSFVYFKTSAGLLTESSLALNLNPTGSPYDGESDDDLADAFPIGISGLVHVIRPAGDVSQVTMVDGSANLEGPLVLDGRVEISVADSITANPALYLDPPPGYTVPTHMAAVPGSWQWESLPIAGVTGL